jgi:ATP-dependent protease ClpP protease subunit
MKYVVLSKQLKDTENFQPLLDIINVGHEEITLIISCGGGDMYYATVLIHIINKNPERFTVVSCSAYSAGFYLLRQTTCKKKIVDGSIGMFHYPYSQMETTESGGYYYGQDKAMVKNNKEYAHQRTRKWCEQFMNAEELAKLESVDDVFFSFKRMLEIFPDIEVI